MVARDASVMTLVLTFVLTHETAHKVIYGGRSCPLKPSHGWGLRGQERLLGRCPRTGIVCEAAECALRYLEAWRVSPYPQGQGKGPYGASEWLLASS